MEQASPQQAHGRRYGNGETTSISLPPTTTGSLEAYLSDVDSRALSALPPGSALLIAHSGANQGARFLLDADVTTVGRHPEAEILLDDVTVSRRHVRFHKTAEGFVLEDLGSLNGTYVNHNRVDKHLLKPRDVVQIGKFRLTFYASAK
ncbi:FHA domain-containing protein [Nesterenkonia populi]|uniref:FHA domain-containing protein n=1 Tax=Nesterenkonia populi TaxID=1591087 RepID=UPI0011BDF99A|nr:FHA domain-containing protein [Nesterenkonia populi]